MNNPGSASLIYNTTSPFELPSQRLRGSVTLRTCQGPYHSLQTVAAAGGHVQNAGTYMKVHHTQSASELYQYTSTQVLLL